MLTGQKLGDALRKAIRLKKITNAEVARAFGVKGPSVYDWLKHGRIGKQHIDQLVAYFSDVVPPEHWGIGVATGHGSRERGSAAVAPRETDTAHHRFPLLEGYAGMGRGDYVGDFPEVVQFVDVTREWAAQALRGVPPGAVRVITGRGPSMRGVFDDGDLVFLDSRVKEFAGDAAYCFRWNGLVYIKRLQRLDAHRLRILSANPDYPPVDAKVDEIEIGGRALAAWTLRVL